MRFPWGFDEEDCGVGLYAGECINALRLHDTELMLFVVTPHEEQATKWTPDLRNRYFKLLEDCTLMELASHRRTPECEYDAYRKSSTTPIWCLPSTIPQPRAAMPWIGRWSMRKTAG